MTILDDYIHFTTNYLLKYKSETGRFLWKFIVESGNELNHKVAGIRCDREYVGNAVIEWCERKSIKVDSSIPNTPQLNGKAERLNRTIIYKAWALLYHSEVSLELWGEAVYTAIYLINRSPTTKQPVTPAELWYGKKLDLSRLQIFGTKLMLWT
jgi:Integrase core domain.